MRIAIVTDSSACLPAELIARYDIRIVPLGLVVDGQVYEDGALAAHDLFARIEASKRGGQTTTMAPAAFLAAFERAQGEGAGAVLCLTLSHAYSGTHAAATGAADLARGALARLPIRVVDTNGLAMTHGFAVLAAARALEAGASLEDAATVAERTGASGRLIGTLDTLSYLVKGGRVPWAVGWAASALRIKPVLSFENGSARAIARPRTWARAKEHMLGEVERRTKGGPLRIAAMHSGDPALASELASAVCERFHPAELICTEFTSVMAVHTGPGFIGLAFHEDA